MTKQTQQLLRFAALGAVLYFILRPKKVTTSSSAADKMKLTCAQGEKLVEEPTGLRCVPVSETVSGPTPSVSLSADGTVICPVCGKQLQTVNGQIVAPGCQCRYGRSFVGTTESSKQALGEIDFEKQKFSNPNVTGIPVRLMSSFDAKSMLKGKRGKRAKKGYANYVDVKANNFFKPQQGAFYQ